MKANLRLRIFAVLLMAAGIFFSSVRAVAEGPIPFDSKMQPAGTQPAVPSMQASQSAAAHHGSDGAGEIVGGRAMIGVGLAVIFFSVLATGMAGTSSDKGKAYAGVGAGAGITAGGVALMIHGFHVRSRK